MTQHLVVIGAGQAASQLVVSARQLGFDGRISVISGEPWLPYQRPPLSKKYLAGEFDRERLFIRPESFYAERGIDFLMQRSVMEIDAAARTIRLDDDATMSYDFLALTTGAAPRRIDIPGSTLGGIHYVRTIADVEAIRAELGEGRRVVIVGAGYIGLEVAASCTALGASVTVLEAAPRILGRVVCDTTAQFFSELHAGHGVSIHCGTAISEFRGNAHVNAVVLADGTIHHCDCVIVGIGVTPNVQLAQQAGLACENGISVDAQTRTSVPGIVAAGDCTSHPHPLIGARVRLESVQNAIEQGRCAASTLFADPRTFEDVPWFWSDQYDIKLQIAGFARDYDTTIVRGDAASKSFAVYYLSGTRLIAVDAIGAPREFITAKKLLAARAALDPEAVANTSVDLEAVAATAS